MLREMIRRNLLWRILPGITGILGIAAVAFLSGWFSPDPGSGMHKNSMTLRHSYGVLLTNPEGAVDSRGNVWMSHYESNSITKLDRNGRTLSPPEGYRGGGLNKPMGLAVDSSGNVWVANYGGNSVTKLDPDGNPLSPSTGYSGGGLNKPMGLAVDSSGNVWVANYGGNSVTKLDPDGNPLSPLAGYSGGGLNFPFSVVIDRAGNVRVANEGRTITDFLGAALPDPERGRIFRIPSDIRLTNGGVSMETFTILGAETLHNELTLLKLIVVAGFLGWMLMFFAYAVELTEPPVESSELDEYGCHFSQIDGGYSCITGRFAGRTFADKNEMLKLAS